MKTRFSPLFPATIFAAALLGGTSLAPAQEADRVDLGEVEPRDIAFSPGFQRTAFVGRSGSRSVAVIDGEKGPKYDEIVKSNSTGQLGSGGVSMSPGFGSPQFAFSPDGSRVAYIGRKGNRKTLHLDDQTFGPYEDTPLFPIFSEDGQRSAFAILMGGHQADKLEIFVDGKSIGVYQRPFGKFQFSPTGKYLLFSAGKSIGADEEPEANHQPSSFLYIVEKDKDEPIVLEMGQSWSSQYQYVATPDDQHSVLAYPTASTNENGQPQMKIILARDGEPTELDQMPQKLQLSDDGKRMAYQITTKSSSGEHKVHLNGKDYEYDTSFGGQLTFSPDLHHFAYQDRVEGGKGRQWIVNGEPGFEYNQLSNLTWSPDGKRYAYVASQGKTEHYVVVDGEESDAFETISIPPRFSADGSQYVFAARAGHHEDELFIDGKPVGTFPRISNLQYDEAGHGLTFSYIAKGDNPGPVIWRNGKLHRIPQGHSLSHFKVSDDGKHLAYAVRHSNKGKNAGYVVVDGKAHPTSPVGYQPGIVGPFFSPDTKHVAYWKGDNAYYLNGTKLPGTALPPDKRYDSAANYKSKQPTSTHAFVDDNTFQYFGHEDGHLIRYRVNPNQVAAAKTTAAATQDVKPGSNTASNPSSNPKPSSTPAKDEPEDAEEQIKNTGKKILKGLFGN